MPHRNDAFIAEAVPLAERVLNDALIGGDEYELLVATRSLVSEAEFTKQFGVALTAIGRVVEGPARVSVGAKRVAPRSGHDHFSR